MRNGFLCLAKVQGVICTQRQIGANEITDTVMADRRNDAKNIFRCITQC